MPASIFNGSSIKLLKDTLRFKSNIDVINGVVNVVVAGFAAPIGSIYLKTDTYQVYVKKTVANTGWLEVVNFDELNAACEAVVTDMNMSGFVSWGGSGDYYSVVGSTFTILRPGVGRIKNLPITWAGGENVTLAVNKAYFIGLSATNTLAAIDYSTIINVDKSILHENFENLFRDYVLLFSVWVDENGIVIACKNTHPYEYMSNIAANDHFRLGSVFLFSGAVISTLNSADRTIQSIGTDLLDANGVISNIPDFTGNALETVAIWKNVSNFAQRFHRRIFTVSGITFSPTEGATYTNNGSTFTVLYTNIVAGSGTITTWRSAGAADPEVSGNLTKTSGTGDVTIAFSAWTYGRVIPVNYSNSGVITSLGTSGATRYAIYAIYAIRDDYQTPNTTTPEPGFFVLLPNTTYSTTTAAIASIGTGVSPNLTQYTMPQEIEILEPCLMGFVLVDGYDKSIPAVTSVGFVNGVKSFKSTSTVSTTGSTTTVASAIDVQAATTNFDGILSVTESNTQLALEKIDDIFKTERADDLLYASIGTPTYKTLKDYTNIMQSSGRLDGGVITAHSPADGTVDMSALSGMIKTTNSATGVNVFFTLAAQSSIALTDQNINYLYCDYNSGTPQILVTTDYSAVRFYDQFIIGRVYRDGTVPIIIQSGINIYDFLRKNIYYQFEKYGIERVSGSMLSEASTRYLAVTAGIFYTTTYRITTAAKNTSGTDTFTLYYRNTPTGWVTITAQQQLGNTQYDDGSGTLATLPSARHGVYWVYLAHTGNIYVLYGQGDYSLAQAQLAAPPSTTPPLVTYNTVLCGKIIFQKNDVNFYSVQSAFTTTFSPSTVTVHNDLAGISGGAAGEYYHLTQTEHTVAQSQSLAKTNATTAPTVNDDSGDGYSVGSHWYDVTNDRSYVCIDATLGAAIWTSAGSGGGEYDFLISKQLSNWVAFDAYTAPEGGGTATGITFAVSGTPISAEPGVITYKFSKDAANRQNLGYGLPFAIRGAIDNYKVRTLKIEARESANYVDGDVGFLLWDDDNNVLIYPAVQDLYASSYVNQSSYEFQLSAAANFRILMYCKSTSALAYDVEFTAKFVETSSVSGAVITDWKATTLTCGLTGAGTLVVNAQERRVGGDCQFRGKISWATVFTGGSATITLPYTIDTTKLPDGGKYYGAAVFVDSGTDEYQGYVTYQSSTQVALIVYKDDLGVSTNHIGVVAVTTTVPMTWANADTINFEFSVPISGWSSNQTLSEDSGNRLIASKVYGSTTALTGGGAAIVFASTAYDTTGSFSSGIYTVKESGKYRVSYSMGGTASATPPTSIWFYIKKNGSTSLRYINIFADSLVGSKSYTFANSDTLDLIAGDTLGLYADIGAQTFTLISVSGSAKEQQPFAVEKLSSPQQIASSEKCYALYETNTATSIASTTANIAFPTEDKVVDTHNMFNASTYTLTCPKSGLLKVSAAAVFASNAGWELGEIACFDLNINTTVKRYFGWARMMATATFVMSIEGNCNYPVNKGDVVKVEIYQNSDGAIALDGAANENFVEFEIT